jgi:hypothetical protein
VNCARFNPFHSAACGLAWLGLLVLGGSASAPVRAGLPAPPMQAAPWTVPAAGDIPTNFIAATETLFAAGMADPRGCEYRSVVVRVGSLWSGDGGKVETHGWVLPGDGEPRHAVCWNGLVYPVLSVGPPADLKRDMQALMTGRYTDRGWIPREADGVSHKQTEPLKGCLLLRLGETDLARDFWLSIQERSSAVRFKVRDLAPAKTFGDKKPAEPTSPAPARIDPQTPDPFPTWATVWAGGALDRTLAAFMRGDDAEALEGARWLATVRDRLNAIGVAFPALGMVSPLLSDLDRRATTPAAEGSIERISEMTNDVERVRAAIATFPEIAVRQRSQYSGLGSWIDAPQFALVVDAGQAAVEPLLASLETDVATRLTRSVSFERDYLPERRLYSVSDVVVDALKVLLRIDDLDTIVPPAKIAEAGTNGSRVLSASLRSYIKNSNAMTAQESWYATLMDDSAGRDWTQAIRDIVAPSRSRSFTRRQPRPGAGSSSTPLAGEILRTKTGPTVTELMVRRIGHWTPLRGDDSYGLKSYRDTVGLLARWDATAALDLTGQTLDDCFRIWEAEESKPDRNAALSKVAARAISTLVVEMAEAGRTNQLDHYASWILKVGNQNYSAWIEDRDEQPNPFAPLWLFPEHPSIAEAAIAMLDPVQSRLKVWLTLDAGLRSLYVIEADSGLSGVPAFQKGLVEALENTTTVGTITRPGLGRYEVKENTGVTYSRRLFADRFLADKLPDMPLRLCDAVAKKLDSWPDMPRFELYWNQSERDAKIEEYLQLIRTEGAGFGRRATKQRR